MNLDITRFVTNQFDHTPLSIEETNEIELTSADLESIYGGGGCPGNNGFPFDSNPYDNYGDSPYDNNGGNPFGDPGSSCGGNPYQNNYDGGPFGDPGYNYNDFPGGYGNHFRHRSRCHRY